MTADKPKSDNSLFFMFSLICPITWLLVNKTRLHNKTGYVPPFKSEKRCYDTLNPLGEAASSHQELRVS